MVARSSARAAELTPAELRAGGARLLELVARNRPRVVAIAGVTAYRIAFGQPGARIGPQERALGPALLWVLPNPSGLNARWSLAAMAEEFGRLRTASGC